MACEIDHFVDARFSYAFDRSYLSFENEGDVVAVRVAVPRIAEVGALISDLKAFRAKQLTRIPISRIVEGLGEVANRWLRPDYHLRQLSERTLPVVTGLSKPMVSTLIDRMFEELTEDSLWQLLVAELGDPLVLDSFRPRPSTKGLSRAYGPEVLVNISGGGNPLLAAQDMICALLTKATFIGRVSSHEPLFASVFARSVAEVDESLATALIVCWWPPDTSEAGLELLKCTSSVVISGTNTTVDTLETVMPKRQQLISYGARIGITLVGREALDRGQVADLTRRAAIDVSLADQRSCLSPQVIYVEEGGEPAPAAFAERLAGELAHLHSVLPRGRISQEALLSFNRFKARYQFRQYGSESDVIVHGLDKRAEWLVVYDPDPQLMPGPGYRAIRVCPVETLDVAVDIIREHEPLVSTVGLAATEERLVVLAEQLGTAGVTRVCSVGKMLRPPLTWHRDGSFHLSPLLTWTDLECDPCRG